MKVFTILLIVGATHAAKLSPSDEQTKSLNLSPVGALDYQTSVLRRQDSYENNESSQLQITAMPDDVSEGITDTLEVECKFSGSTLLMSLVISRKEEDGTCGLAYITSAKSGIQKVDPSFAGEVSGGLGADGKSGNLRIKWTAPTTGERGVYECLVSTMETFGKFHNYKKTVKVAVTPMKVEDLSKKVMGRINQLESILAEERKTISAMQKALFTESSVYKGRRYFLSEYSALTYLKADDVCKAMGGYLAEIDNKEEYEFVRSFVSVRMWKSSLIMIAGTDADREGTWVFKRTGRPVGFLDWDPSQPDGGRGENCLVFFHHKGILRMGDYVCHSGHPGTQWRQGFLCEVEDTRNDE